MIERVVVEATGHYEKPLVECSINQGLPIIVVQPILIRRFAGACNVLAKTDKIDAGMIAQFAAVMKPEIRSISSKEINKVKDLVVRRRQLLSLLKQEKNRLSIMPKEISSSIKSVIKMLDREMNKIEKNIQDAVDQVAEWENTEKILISTPGVSIFRGLFIVQSIGYLWVKPAGFVVRDKAIARHPNTPSAFLFAL